MVSSSFIVKLVLKCIVCQLHLDDTERVMFWHNYGLRTKSTVEKRPREARRENPAPEITKATRSRSGPEVLFGGREGRPF